MVLGSAKTQTMLAKSDLDSEVWRGTGQKQQIAASQIPAPLPPA